MKLSQELYNDFLRELMESEEFYNPGASWSIVKTRTYKMSHDYLVDLIEKVEKLENPEITVELGKIQ